MISNGHKSSLIAVLGCSLLLSTSASAEPFTSQQQKALVNIIKQQEKALNGTIGMAVLDTDSGSVWNYNGEMRFPMMSTFKSLALRDPLIISPKHNHV
ncbi:hypothetical protein FD718_15900 [Photobacterium damselae subsp. damselae]|nr:hypothetical protein FD718_15900 [Photobacterium damselae subsp. damselae]